MRKDIGIAKYIFPALIIVAIIVYFSWSNTNNDKKAIADAVDLSQSITVNGVAYKVENVEQIKKSDNVFSIVVTVTAKNNGTKEAVVSSDMFRLVDVDEREYNGDLSRDIFGDDYFSGSIQPGLSKTANVKFDVSISARGFRLGVNNGNDKFTFINLGQ